MKNDPSSNEALSQVLAERVLEKLGFPSPSRPTADRAGLAALYAA